MKQPKTENKEIIAKTNSNAFSLNRLIGKFQMPTKTNLMMNESVQRPERDSLVDQIHILKTVHWTHGKKKENVGMPYVTENTQTHIVTSEK